LIEIYDQIMNEKVIDFLQQNAKIESGIAQITAMCQSSIKQMPPGMLPPLVIQYDASSVPVIQLSLSSETIPESQLFDLAVNFLRPQLVTIPGVQIPYPYGGRQRQIMVDLDPDQLHSFGVTATDVSNVINATLYDRLNFNFNRDIAPIYAPGVLLDLTRFRGVDRLPNRELVGPDELAACAESQGIEIERGDVVLVRFPHPSGLRGKKRPAVIVQSDSYATLLSTLIIACVTV